MDQKTNKKVIKNFNPKDRLNHFLYSLIEHIPESMIIDCGCGYGEDSYFFARRGLIVNAFDIEPSTIEKAKKHSPADCDINFEVNDFKTFNYPEANMFLAYSSLFFCPKNCFPDVWLRIKNSIKINGYFCGNFLGNKDDWVTEKNTALLYFADKELKELFSDFEIIRWNEKLEKRRTLLTRTEKQWHVYTIVARKVVSSC